MTWIFHEHIRIFIRVYLDDIFVYSNVIEDHEDIYELPSTLCEGIVYS
jgi:hypothetical protein